MRLTNDEFIQIVDVETTGFDVWRNSLIVFSSVIANLKTLDFVEQYTGYAKPESKKFWSDDAEKVHGFSYEEAMTFKEPREAAIDWLNFLVPFKCKDNFPMTTIYHGRGNFDPRWCDAFFYKNKMWHSWQKVSSLKETESTFDLAKKHLDIENYKLNTICSHLNIGLDHHKAESDALACYEIYKKLKNFEGDILAET